MTRRIDTAMAEQRPDKETMRQIWVDAVAKADSPSQDPPLYLTLPGAHGLDVKRLVDAGLVRLAENGAIAADHVWKVVAVESNKAAYTALKSRMPGLRVLNVPISGILASTGPLTWPRGEHERWCRARVINLDLNGALHCERDAQDGLIFPTMQLIAKFAQLHLKTPALDWVLCMTVAATIDWPAEDCEFVQRFLRENFQRESQFAEDSQRLLGASLFDAINTESPVDMNALTRSEQQTLLMVFVPKKIVAETYSQGWRIATTYNVRYGGRGGSQRMASWVIRFELEPRVTAEPQAVYSESVALALSRVCTIGPDGTLS
jgi:hypothetical protein